MPPTALRPRDGTTPICALPAAGSRSSRTSNWTNRCRRPAVPNLPHSLRAELEWAVQLLAANGSPSGDQMQTIHNAIHAKSTMLAKRFALFIDNSRPYHIEREDTNRLGALLLALEAHAGGQPWHLYQPGEWEPTESTKGTVIQIRCSESWKARLQAYCHRSNSDLSKLIRASVEEHLRDNPLWMTQDDRRYEPTEAA
jgi:hypothetical protein